MQCPHCLQHFFSKPQRNELGRVGDDEWTISLEACPNCNDAIISVMRLQPTEKESVLMVHPRSVSRPALSSEIPDAIAQDYAEAAELLTFSPKASAALGRRCLRELLHHIGFRDVDLDTEIATLIGTRQLPKILAEWVDAVREVGKYHLYPVKSTRSEEIHPVEEGEAEVLLDALDCLFQFYFVQPAEMRKKREDLLTRLNIAWRNTI